MTEIKYMTPKQWGAKTVGLKARMSRLPARSVFLHHSVTNPTANAIADAQFVERIGIQRFGRLSYSYMIHPNGTVLEGQGLYRGAHTVDEKSAAAKESIAQKGYGISRNNDAFSICFIGDYMKIKPSEAQLRAAAFVISKLALEGHLAYGYDISRHRDVKNTACPGNVGDYVPTIRSHIVDAVTEIDFKYGSIGFGDKGVAVHGIQTLLTALGYDVGGVDGQYGTKTVSQVAAFQQDRNLAKTGVWDEGTHRAAQDVFFENNKPPAQPERPAPPEAEPSKNWRGAMTQKVDDLENRVEELEEDARKRRAQIVRNTRWRRRIVQAIEQADED